MSVPPIGRRISYSSVVRRKLKALRRRKFVLDTAIWWLEYYRRLRSSEDHGQYRFKRRCASE